jgi:hypothetical protein
VPPIEPTDNVVTVKATAEPTVDVARESAVVAGQPVESEPWWVRGAAGPRDVPELLARAAVDRYGDSAYRYTRWLAGRYPYATPDGMARVAIERFGRQGRYAVLGGPAGVAALLGVQAQLVLHIAAAYGRDPRDPRRAGELLALLGPNSGAATAATRVFGRLASRWVPGAGVLVSALVDAGALDRTARRAMTFYREKQQ